MQVVELVEIPLVEQEAVEQLVLARELDRQVRPRGCRNSQATPKPIAIITVGSSATASGT